MDVQELWQTALARLRKQIQSTACTWFAETAAFSLVDNELIVGVKSLTPLTHLECYYDSEIRAILADMVGRAIKVKYVNSFGLSKLFDTGKLPPDLPGSKVKPNLDVANILILIEKKGNYSGLQGFS